MCRLRNRVGLRGGGVDRFCRGVGGGGEGVEVQGEGTH